MRIQQWWRRPPTIWEYIIAVCFVALVAVLLSYGIFP